MQRQHMLKTAAEKISRLSAGRKKRFFLVLASIALLLASLTSQPLTIRHSASSQGLNNSPSPDLIAGSALTKTKAQSGESSKLYSQYWYLDRHTAATLEITNNAAATQTVIPTLLLEGVERVPLDPVTIPSRATKRISLNQALRSRSDGGRSPRRDRRWGDGSRIGGIWGSAILQCASAGAAKAIASKLLSENQTESLAVHNGFYEGEYGSRVLSSMWWLPTRNTTALFALQNISHSELPVMTTFYLDGRVVPGRNVNLSAGGSSLLDLRDLLPDHISKGRLPEVGMVRFVANSESGSLMGRTILFDQDRGFSVPLAMHGLVAHSTNTLQMPGAPFGRPDRRLGFSRGARFTTQLLLTNTSGKSINVTVTLDGKNSAGEPISWDLPVTELASLESRLVNLNKARVQGNSPIVDGHVGVRLAHTGTALDLSVEAVTVDQTLSLSFDNTFYDSGSFERVYYAVSFNLRGDKNTLLLIKNISDKAGQFGYKLSYEQQGVVHTYKATLSELKPYELRVVDIKSLRDSGVEDADGRVLPDDVQFGNAIIYSNQLIIAGDPNYDPVTGISSSCIQGCGPCNGCFPIECPPEGCPTCDPCVLDPSLCQPQCTDTCTPCLNRRSIHRIGCISALVACEATATANFNNCVNGCENMAFCRQGDPNFNQEECDRCKDGCANTHLIASAACGSGFTFCMLTIPDCSGEKTSTCGSCINN